MFSEKNFFKKGGRQKGLHLLSYHSQSSFFIEKCRLILLEILKMKNAETLSKVSAFISLIFCKITEHLRWTYV